MKMIKGTLKVGFVLAILGGSTASAQSIADVKKALDAEQYHKAKSSLKSMIAAQPANAEAHFHLGNVYLLTGYPDSAKVTFNKGISANAQYSLNYVGLG